MQLLARPSLQRLVRYRLLALVVLALLAAAVMWVIYHHRAPGDGYDGRTQEVTYSEPHPSEAKPDSAYTVPAGQPLSIEIASQGIKGFIQRVGTDQHKAVAAPNNIHLAGWYVDSVLPGKTGLSVIDGHVEGVSQKGIFYKLGKVKLGDEVVVSYGDRSIRRYTVFKTKTVDADDAVHHIFDQDPQVASQLNLITCAGSYDEAQGSYDKRVVVSASLK